MNSKRSILVVDDEPNVCAYLKDLIEYFGYEVTLAYSCRKTFEQLKARTFDCLLLDLYMKNDCGETVLHWLRALDRQDAVVMMCAMPDHELRTELILKGACDVLAKPIQPTQLRQILRNMVEPVLTPDPQPFVFRPGALVRSRSLLPEATL
jgi:DNA-binding NtrC family response regulator